MSKKVLTPMKDESPDFQKQIGCISGFFQLFDRHRFITGQRSSSQSHSIPTQGGTRKHIKELNNTAQKSTAKNVKAAKENQPFSTCTESSGTSMSSSSCSSSMSSMDFSRTIQMEPPSTSQIKIPENFNSGAQRKQQPSPRRPQSLDCYDIVKDSMHKDAQGLSVKTVAKGEKKGRILRHIDSPRPLQAPISVKTGAMVAWDSPRLSYDGRDVQDTFKSATKHKELPRLSLDSRKGSIKSFNEGTKSRNFLKAPEKEYGGASAMHKQLQEPETSKRPSSVVAKLMGLESFPDCAQTCDTPRGISSCTTNKVETSAGSSTNDEFKQPQSSASPRTSKGSNLLPSTRDASIMIVKPYAQFSQEATPLRQADASQGSQLQISKRNDCSTKATNASLSVYGQIEKRVADLEFKKSGKDLRALKQILEAMQRYKESIDITSDQASNSPSDNRNDSNLRVSLKVQSPRIQQKDSTSATVEISNSTQGSKSPIVIVKPAKVARKTNDSAFTEMRSHGKSGLSKFGPGNPRNRILVDKLDMQTTKDSPAMRHVNHPTSQPFHAADKSNKMRTSKLMQSSKVPRVINGESNTTSTSISENRSPRVQKKIGLERRSPATSPSSDSSSNRRQHNRHSTELSSASVIPRQKFSTLQERNELLSEITYQRMGFKHGVDVILPDFGSKRSMGSHSDIEDIHIDHPEKINSNSIQLKGLSQNNAENELSQENLMAEKIVTAEQPSPVSVLDAAFYKEDPPSPIKRKLEISKDLDEALNTYDIDEENSEDLPLSSNTTKANFSNGTRDIDFKTHNLVQVIRQIDYSDERFTNFSDSKDPEHKYVSEILLASGLLTSPSSSQAFYSSGYPINPTVFLALEQIQTGKKHFNVEHGAKKIVKMNNPQQMQRKLIFDVINEILVQKLILESSTLWCQPNQPAGRKLKGKQLLDDLCTKIDKLQHKNRNLNLAHEDEKLTSLLWEDLTQQPTTCAECFSEIPNVVLDIERLIFKDLITEAVRG